MPRPRVYRTEAVVVRQAPAGEADRVLTMLSPERGQMKVLARGVRRATGKLTGHLELLNRVTASVAEGRNLDIVAEAECLSAFPALRQDLERLAAGLYIAEIADAFSVAQEQEAKDPIAREIYGLLVGALTLLEEGWASQQLVACVRMKILAISGLEPQLFSCVECGGRLEETDHVFCAEAGGVVCPDCKTSVLGRLVPASVPAIKVMRYFATAQLRQAATLKVSGEILGQVDRVQRSHLAQHLDRPPRSGGFLEAIV